MDTPIQQQARYAPPGTARAGTHIYVSPQVTTAHVPPDFTLPGQVRSAASAPPSTASQAKSTTQINWGGIVKGALIVTAVVGVAVVGAWLLSGFAASAGIAFAAGETGFMGTLGGVLHSTAGMMAGVFDVAAGIGEVGWKSLVTVGTGLQTGFTAASLGGSTALTSTPAAFLWTQNAISGTAAWIGGLGAGTAALLVAAKPLAMIPLIEPAIHGAAPNGSELAAGSMAAKKNIAIHQAPTHSVQGADQYVSMPDPTDSLIDESAVQASSKAMKVVHHAAEDSHEYRQHRTARELLARSTSANQSWTQRTAATRTPPAAVQSRQQRSFTENLAADQARAAALPEGSRG